MTPKELKAWQETLLSTIGTKLRQYGLDKRKDQSFYKKEPFGRATFHVSFINHQNDFDVTGDVAVRFDQTEEMADPDSKDSHTIGAELGNLKEGRQKRWTVTCVDDIPLIADAAVKAFAEIGLPYVEEFSDQARALDVLSGDGPDSWLHSPLHSARAERAVSMALTLKGREAAEALAKRKLSFLEQRKDSGLPLFRAFLQRNGIVC
jgi:hypothetical protein